MSNQSSDVVPQLSRPVLIWGAEGDTSLVRPGVQEAAEFLKVSVDEVLAAIASGDMIGEYFVDWEAAR